MKKLALSLALALGLLTLGVFLAGVQAPSRAQQSVIVPATMASVSIAGTVAVATEIVPLTAGQRIYITGIWLTPLATSVVTLTTGTGTNCGTSTASLTGAQTFAAGQEVTWGSGNGALIVTPPSFALCITIATAVAPGVIAYAKF